MSTNEDQLFDVRLLDRHITKGRTTRKDYQKWAKAQDDLEAQVVVVDYEHLTATGAQKVPKAR